MATDKLDELLEARGLKFEELTADERENYLQWLDTLEAEPLTLEELKKYLEAEKQKVELELAETDEFDTFFFGVFRRPNRKNLLLKAQLKTYLFIEALLGSRERKKKVIEAQLDRLVKLKANRGVTIHG